MQPQSNTYDFIMNPGKPPRRSLLPGLGGKSQFIGRIAVVLGIAVVVIILFTLASSLLGGSSNTPRLTIVAEQQNALLNIANLGNTIGASQSSQPNLDFTQSCMLTITSAQQGLTTFLTQHGVKLSTKTLALAENPATSTTLNNAVASSSFNGAYDAALQTQLQLYESSLKSAFDNAKNADEQQLLSSDYKGAQLLTQELNSQYQ
jgi:hypothetical protein